MSTKIAIVIPVYREINELEKISLAQCRKVLSRYPIVFVAPEGKNFSYIKPGDSLVEFPAQYFQSLKTYSNLLTTPQFYEAFAGFDYILIYQLDAFVFYDALEEFCALGYDYIGAPWPRYAWKDSRVDGKVPRVGNGGFSLRNVRVCRDLFTNLTASPYGRRMFELFVEDALLAFCGVLPEINFNVAPVEVAALFSMEWYPARHMKRFGLPFGCHNWHRFSADFYVELFARFGYDLQPFRAQMGDEDLESWRCFQVDFAMNRLIRDVNHGRSLLQYLPTKRFASIRVIRSPQAIKLLSCLLSEENSLSDEIFIYDENEWTNLLRDVTAKDLPHLLFVADYDVSLIKALERGGLRYGEHIISFQREYLKHCAQILRTFGR